jgi:ketosteroid isomerase-like protein
MKRMIQTLLLGLVLTTGCSEPPDEQQIRENLNRAVDAVRAREPKSVVEHLTEDFIGQERMTTEQVRRFMLAQFFRNQNINVVITGLKISVEGDSARVEFRAVLAGGLNWLPERLDYYQINSRWRKRDGDWRIHRASWKPVLLD